MPRQTQSAGVALWRPRLSGGAAPAPAALQATVAAAVGELRAREMVLGLTWQSSHRRRCSSRPLTAYPSGQLTW
ncbi:unnamed protein product, partial [Polarella glacialis]